MKIFSLKKVAMNIISWGIAFTLILSGGGSLLSAMDPHWPIQSFETEAAKIYGEDSELLFLGNSHFYSGINPEWISSYKAVQISSSAIDYSFQLMLLKHFIDEMPHLKKAVLQVSRQPLDDNTYAIRTGDFDLFFALGVSAFAIPRASLSSQIKLYFQSLSFIRPIVRGPKFSLENLKSLLKGVPKKKKYPFALKAGFLPIENVYKPPQNKRDAIEAYRRKHPQGAILSSKSEFRGPNGDDKSYAINSMAFVQILEIFKSRGIEVVFLRTPLYPSEQTFELGVKDLLDLAGPKGSFKFLDLYNDERFSPEDFKDHRHLNISGAKKLSKILNEAI